MIGTLDFIFKLKNKEGFYINEKFYNKKELIKIANKEREKNNLSEYKNITNDFELQDLWFIEEAFNVKLEYRNEMSSIFQVSKSVFRGE